MCNTPTYCDLGKAAKDVFNKGYGFGMVKIDLRTKSCSGVEFSTSGHAYTDTGKASGNLETKYKICNYGLTFTQKWNTDNTLGTEVSLENKLAEGLKLTLDTIFVPNTGNDGTEFGGSIYQKVNEKIETSINLAWTAGSNNTRFGIAAKYKLDCRTSLCAKVNNASLIGLGYTQTLRPGVKLTLSALIDGKNFNAGGHKVGLGFELEA
ncbi:voltage-dependent anion-selective channel protein 3 isoform X10 [Phocoena phocoena]|uniref:voltage-dependent anion-selective channel protein 3 isoform X10 n=1 Tax=Phocoena phocoena TaxID=9742 RepID=UPI003307C0EE